MEYRQRFSYASAKLTAVKFTVDNISRSPSSPSLVSIGSNIMETQVRSAFHSAMHLWLQRLLHFVRRSRDA